MPDLIRHPAKIGNTGFRVKPGMTLIAISNVNLTFIENRKNYLEEDGSDYKDLLELELFNFKRLFITYVLIKNKNLADFCHCNG